MGLGDVVLCWILALPAILAFFSVYGLVEETPCQIDWPDAAHGYDIPELFREDALVHIRENDRAVAEHERNIQAILAEIHKRERGQ